MLHSVVIPEALYRLANEGVATVDKSSSEDGGTHDRDPVVQVRLVSDDVEAFKKYVETTPFEFACAGPRLSAEGIVTAHVLMRQSVAKQATSSGAVKVEIVADVSAVTDQRRAEVGRGNRFADPRVIPIGRGSRPRKSS